MKMRQESGAEMKLHTDVITPVMPEGSSARETPRMASTAPETIAHGTGLGSRDLSDSFSGRPVLAFNAAMKPEKTNSTCPKSINAI